MSSTKLYRPWNPDQPYLLPPSAREWLPEGHLAYFILDVVQEMDLRAIEEAIHQKDARGNRPYDPRMMVSLLLYAYCVGVFSSRRIERATYEDVAFRVITGEDRPTYSRICAFRREHLTAFEKLFVQVVVLCQKMGLVKLGHVAIDGTKIQANASKHKAMSYERMEMTEERLKAEIADLLAKAEQTDQQEDAKYGVGQREEDLPTELRRREDRLAKLRQTKAALEEEAGRARAAHLRDLADGCDARAEDASDEKQKRKNERLAKKHRTEADKLDPPAPEKSAPAFTTDSGLPMNRPPATVEGLPKPNAQRNFTDPDSRIMESGGSFIQGYNCQAAVDDTHQIIVAADITNQSPDNGNLIPMVEQAKKNCAASPSVVTADAGYWQPTVEDECTALGTAAYVSTRRRRHGEADPVTEEPPSEDLDPRERMQAKVNTAEGKQLYARRKAIVEPVFGQIKECRGFRRFLLRGFDKVRGEWRLVCLAHNILKMFRMRAAAAA